jgi:KaiC/GvpD/RAD55 family RecA-like ATPase
MIKMSVVEELSPEMKKFLVTLTETLKQGQAPQDDYQIASAPMNTSLAETQELEKYVLTPTLTPETNGKTLIGISTGTFLDNFFLDPHQQPLKAIPVCSQIAITGLSGSGKSILTEEMSIRVASQGKRVLYVLGEDIFKSDSPRLDLQSRLIQKAKILGLDWNSIQPNLFVLDTIKFPELRDWKTFAEAYRYACEKHKIDIALIDSITVLETSRYHLKYRVIELIRYNQLNGITAIFINQRSEEKDDISGMSGGYGLDYQYDVTVIVDFCRPHNFTPKQMLAELNAEKGEFVRYARVLDCRLCGFDRRYVRLDITDNGFIRTFAELESAPAPIPASA